jgi:hypothetical protein
VKSASIYQCVVVSECIGDFASIEKDKIDIRFYRPQPQTARLKDRQHPIVR